MASLPPLPHRGPIGFSLDGNRFELPDIPTPVWLSAMCSTTPEGQPHKLLAAWWQLIPGQLPEVQARHLHRRLSDPHDFLDLDQLEKHTLTLLSAPLGVEFHVAQRLIAAVRSEWMLFDARCASFGLDPYQLHISRIVNMAFSARLEMCEKESERYTAKAQLWAPPDGTRASGRSWDDDPDVTARLDEIEASAFDAIFG